MDAQTVELKTTEELLASMSLPTKPLARNAPVTPPQKIATQTPVIKLSEDQIQSVMNIIKIKYGITDSLTCRNLAIEYLSQK